jgi:tetratricopeptide (TPR) repeat protein
VELRQPPITQEPPNGPTKGMMLILNLVTIAVVAALVIWGNSNKSVTNNPTDSIREVASKLKAAGAIEPAAHRYADWIENNPAHPDRGTIAYSVGNLYLELGKLDEALRWFYEAEVAGVGDMQPDLAKKLVHTLERLGRVHAARAVLSGQTQLTPVNIQRSKDDVVVAEIGDQKIYRSDLQRSLDDMPPEFAKELSGPQNAPKLLQKHVADELVWRKAQKLEYENKPEVQRRLAQMHKHLVVGHFLEQEVTSNIQVEESDLRNFFQAQKAMFKQGDKEPTFEQAKPAVEQAYRMMKVQKAYSDVITQEMSAGDVKLYPERLTP